MSLLAAHTLVLAGLGFRVSGLEFRHTHLLSLLEPHMPRYWPGGHGEIEQGKHSAGPVVLLR